MPEYLSPGVYVEEVDAGPKPIEGVSTSTAGAVGVTERGPTGGAAPGDTTNRGKPVLVTSFADFMRTFGGFLPEADPATVNRWALIPANRSLISAALVSGVYSKCVANAARRGVASADKVRQECRSL